MGEVDGERIGRVRPLFSAVWPVGPAVGCAGLMWGLSLESAARLLLVLPLIYLALAAVGRRGWSWPVLAVAFAMFLALELQSSVEPAAVLCAVAGAVALIGLRSHAGRRRAVACQGLAFVGFAAVAVVALTVAPESGRWLAAAGWLAHGLWDVAHWRRNRVVSRSYAQWCGVLDLLVAAGLLLA